MLLKEYGFYYSVYGWKNEEDRSGVLQAIIKLEATILFWMTSTKTHNILTQPEIDLIKFDLKHKIRTRKISRKLENKWVKPDRLTKFYLKNSTIPNQII